MFIMLYGRLSQSRPSITLLKKHSGINKIFFEVSPPSVMSKDNFSIPFKEAKSIVEQNVLQHKNKLATSKMEVVSKY
jgi:hypothetical protein